MLKACEASVGFLCLLLEVTNIRVVGGARQASGVLQQQTQYLPGDAKDAGGSDRITQFGRALMDPNIEIISANSPQAKGRIERAFGILQDRMVKELRLAGISTVAAANAWLPDFIASYKARLGRPHQRPDRWQHPTYASFILDDFPCTFGASTDGANDVGR
jgi:hypothetical protein